MAKDNKVVTYKQANGKTAMTGATQTEIEQLRAGGHLKSVRRVRTDTKVRH